MSGYGKIIQGQQLQQDSLATGSAANDILGTLESELSAIDDTTAMASTVVSAGGSLAQGYVEGQNQWSQMEKGADQVGLDGKQIVSDVRKGAGPFERAFGPGKKAYASPSIGTNKAAGGDFYSSGETTDGDVKIDKTWSIDVRDLQHIGKTSETLGKKALIGNMDNSKSFEENVRASGWGQYTNLNKNQSATATGEIVKLESPNLSDAVNNRQNLDVNAGGLAEGGKDKASGDGSQSGIIKPVNNETTNIEPPKPKFQPASSLNESVKQRDMYTKGTEGYEFHRGNINKFLKGKDWKTAEVDYAKWYKGLGE